jgi:hypothetical protein
MYHTAKDALPRPALRLMGCLLLLTGAMHGQAPGTSAPVGVAATRWTIFRDPAQNAFSLLVPAGWKVQGRSISYSTADTRSFVNATAPDASIYLFIGDPNSGLYRPMDQGTAFSCRATRRYCPGDTVPMGTTNVILRDYIAGADFAAGYARQLMGQSCTGLSVYPRDLPQAAQRIQYAGADLRQSLRAGEAQFQCSYQGTPVIGYVFAATELVELPGNAIWQVKSLAGYIAHSDQQALDAWYLLGALTGSLRVNPQWLAAVGAAAAQQSAILAAVNNAVSASINETFQNYMNTHDRTSANFSRYQRGEALFNDPDLGNVNMPNVPHQWKLPDGTRMGTDSDRPPVPGAQEIPVVYTGTP